MAVCPAFDAGGPYVGNVLAWADCRLLGLGEDGYRALGPQTLFGGALTGLLTIYVALVGYRLLFGERLSLRDGAGIALRLGAVVALATQWPAYRVLVFDLATGTPAQLAGAMLAPSGLTGGEDLGLVARIDGVEAALADLLTPPAPPPPPLPGTNAEPASAAQSQAQQPAQARDLPLAARAPVENGATILALSSLASLLSVRLVMGLLLALGPVFIACLLFEPTRGLFGGWVRVLVGAMLGALAVPLVLALELAVLEPQVLALRDRVDGGQALGTMPLQLLVTVAVAALVLLAALVASARVGAGFALPLAIRRGATSLLGEARATPATLARAVPAEAPTPLSRARQVAEAARTLAWRETMRGRDGAASQGMERLVLAGASPLASARDTEPAPAPEPLGQGGRRTAPRRSIGASRRDERA